MGKNAACSLTGGGYNIVFGGFAGKSLAATGNHNFFGGYQAGCQSIGCYNVFLGRHTGRSFTSGNNNVYIGNCAGGQTGTKTGSSNIAIGVQLEHKVPLIFLKMFSWDIILLQVEIQLVMEMLS